MTNLLPNAAVKKSAAEWFSHCSWSITYNLADKKIKKLHFQKQCSSLLKWFILTRNGWHLYLLLIPLCTFFFSSFCCSFMRWLKKSCHLSHCCSQQQGQVEEFMLDEQCSWGVLKQRRRFDVSTSPRWTKKLHPQSREVDNCRRRSSELAHTQAEEGMYRPGAVFCIVLDFIYMYSSQIQTDKGKQEPEHVWDVIIAADNRSSEQWLFIFLWISACVLTVCQLLPHTHTHLKALTFPPSYHGHKSTGPKIVTASDVHTSQADKSGKGALPLAVQWKCKWAGSLNSHYITLLSFWIC